MSFATFHITSEIKIKIVALGDDDENSGALNSKVMQHVVAVH